MRFRWTQPKASLRLRALDCEQVTHARKERFSNGILLEQEQRIGSVLSQVGSRHGRQRLTQVLPRGAA